MYSVICRKATFRFPMLITSLPDANFPSSRAQNRHFCVRTGNFSLVFAPFLSTKSGFLCFFGLRNPRFRAFRAQNRGFCAFLGSETLIFGRFEHKIGVFVLFWASGPPFSGLLSTKSGFLCACFRKHGLWKQKSAQIFVFARF